MHTKGQNTQTWLLYSLPILQTNTHMEGEHTNMKEYTHGRYAPDFLCKMLNRSFLLSASLFSSAPLSACVTGAVSIKEEEEEEVTLRAPEAIRRNLSIRACFFSFSSRSLSSSDFNGLSRPEGHVHMYSHQRSTNITNTHVPCHDKRDGRSGRTVSTRHKTYQHRRLNPEPRQTRRCRRRLCTGSLRHGVRRQWNISECY